MLGTIWSTSSGVSAIIDTLNQAYDIQEARPWWKVKLIALGLTVALASFIVVSTVLVLVGPTLGGKVAAWAHLGPAFTWTWKIVQWPLVFALVTLGHRARLLLRAGCRAGVDLDHARFDLRDGALAPDLARVPVLRHPLRVL